MSYGPREEFQKQNLSFFLFSLPEWNEQNVLFLQRQAFLNGSLEQRRSRWNRNNPPVRSCYLFFGDTQLKLGALLLNIVVLDLHLVRELEPLLQGFWDRAL